MIAQINAERIIAIFIKIMAWSGIFLFLYLIHNFHILSSDEGVALAGAWDLYNGKKMYTDTFQFTTPGIFYFLYYLWLLVLPTYAISKLVSVALLFGCAVGIFAVSQKIFKSKLGYLAVFIFMLNTVYWPVISYHVYSIFFLVWSAYYFLGYLDKNSFLLLALSGFLAGVSFLFLQHRSLAMLFVGVIFIAINAVAAKEWRRIKDLFVFSAGFLGPAASLLLFWPISLLYENLFLFPSFNYSEVNFYPLPLFYFFVFLTLLAGLLLRNNNRQINFLLGLQVVLLLTVLSRADIQHIAFVLFPMFALGPVLAVKLNTGHPLLRIYKYGLAFLVAVILITPSWNYIFLLRQASVKNHQEFFKFIETQCSGTPHIYSGPFMPGLYFETKKQNPLPYSWLVTGLNTKEQFIQSEKTLREIMPACAVLNYNLTEPFNYDRNNPVDNFIRENYKPVFKDKNTFVYKVF